MFNILCYSHFLQQQKTNQAIFLQKTHFQSLKNCWKGPAQTSVIFIYIPRFKALKLQSLLVSLICFIICIIAFMATFHVEQ